MSKSVLLARPHPFIVNEMRPWLETAGFSVIKPETAADVAQRAQSCSRAVVSLALSSPVGLTPEEVVHILLKEAPSARSLFAALLPFDKARPALEKLAHLVATSQGGRSASLVDIGSADTAAAAALGRNTTLAYIAKDDLANEARRALAAKHLGRHFA
ncbi:MAG: hypothetical protein ACK4K3_13055 [Aquabacterium sp.]